MDKVVWWKGGQRQNRLGKCTKLGREGLKWRQRSSREG